MQVSQSYRRGIVLPLDTQTEEQLRRNDLDESARVEYLSIPSQHIFELLWESQIFADINDRCGTLIDDYEEEFVELSSLNSVIDATKRQMNSPKIKSLPEVQRFLMDLVQLAAKARSENRPLLFVL